MERLNFLMEQLEGQYGPEELERIRSGYACRRRTSLRVNPLRADPRQAEEMLDRLTKQMAQHEGVTEALKARNQVAWVGAMNNIRARAEEVVRAELIYI